MPIEVKKSELEKLINEDKLKMEQLAAHYDLPMKTMKDIVKKAGLRIRNYSRVPKAVFVDDTTIPNVDYEEVPNQPLVQAVVLPIQEEVLPNSQEEIAATTEPPVINPPIITEVIPEAVPETPSTEDFIF